MPAVSTTNAEIHFDTTQAEGALTSIIEKIKEVVGPLFTWIREVFAPLLPKIKEVIDAALGLFAILYQAFMDVWTVIEPCIRKLTEEILPMLIEVVSLVAGVISVSIQIQQQREPPNRRAAR